MLLIYLSIYSLLSCLIIACIPKNKVTLIKQLSLFLSILVFFHNIYIWYKFKIPGDELFQFISERYYFSSIWFSVGIDGISLYFLLLTTFLIPVSLLVNWESVHYRTKDFTLLLLVLEFLLINIFISTDILFFYIFFEGVLIPMFLIIGIWGSRQRKIHAVYQFFFYTFFGSVLMLLSILIIYLHTGSTSLGFIPVVEFSQNRQLVLWLGFFLAFAIKVPMIPFHIWLPEAHVEAPTTGSILLAGILLKLGTYGFLRFLIPLFPYANEFFKPLVFVICLLGVVFGSFATIRQTDLKKIIAYSSVVHMNFAIIGLFTGTLEGIQGSIFLMISHGIVSAALFFCIGILYDRYHTRILYYYGGLVQTMPIFSLFFLVFTLSNMGFPGTSGFIGEILILIGMFSFNSKVAIFLATSMVFSAIYSLWLYNRVMFGDIKINFSLTRNLNHLFYYVWFKRFADLTKREFFIFIPFLVINFILGIFPNVIFNYTYVATIFNVIG